MMLEDKTRRIIKCFYEVYNTLGYGFLEKIYENAMMLLFKEKNIFAEQQKKIEVFFRNKIIGEYYSDILIENKIVKQPYLMHIKCDG